MRIRPLRPLANNRGMALLVALFSMTIMLFIAMEVSYETNVEYTIAAQQVNKLKARYAAEAGVELSLLRILIYRQAIEQFGEQLGSNKRMLDPIWQFPFAWPPVMPEEMSTVDKDLIQSAVEESIMDAQYAVSIENESGKIDINDIASVSPELAKASKAQILQIFERKMENDDDFRRKYGAVRFEEVVNNIADWVDEDERSLNGGDESRYYEDLSLQEAEFIPPNKPFKTLQELRLVAGMRDDFYKMLAPKVTVYGVKGVNVNYADKNVIQALDREQITDEIATEIINRRESPQLGGPFTGEEDFFNFLDSIGVNSAAFNPAGVPLLYDTEYNFRIKSAGQARNVKKEITAVTYDVKSLKERYVKILKQAEEENDSPLPREENSRAGNNQENAGNQDQQPSGEGAGEQGQDQLPTGRPAIVYWHET